MTVFLALLAVLVPASVTLTGFWFKQQSEKRLAQEASQEKKRMQQEQEQENERLRQQQKQENDRLRLDAAMQAAELFGSSSTMVGSASRSASGLLALARLDFAELAVALLVDLWHPDPLNVAPEEATASDLSCVSTEVAIQVINAAIKTHRADAQLMAAELLCRNSCALDINNSLHWPSSINGTWIARLPMAAKLLIVDALVHTALASSETRNSLRELAVRLYGISEGDPEERVKNCIGILLCAIMPAVRNLKYDMFMRGPTIGFVTLGELENAATKNIPNPDGHFEAIAEKRSQQLAEWSKACTTTLSSSAGMLAPASCGIRAAHDEAVKP
jgi:hypothetical protein